MLSLGGTSHPKTRLPPKKKTISIINNTNKINKEIQHTLINNMYIYIYTHIRNQQKQVLSAVPSHISCYCLFCRYVFDQLCNDTNDLIEIAIVIVTILVCNSNDNSNNDNDSCTCLHRPFSQFGRRPSVPQCSWQLHADVLFMCEFVICVRGEIQMHTRAPLRFD